MVYFLLKRMFQSRRCSCSGIGGSHSGELQEPGIRITTSFFKLWCLTIRGSYIFHTRSLIQDWK